MKIAIITIAGISARFNEGIPEAQKALKAVYYEGDKRNTLLYHLLQKCAGANRIILVGGYQAGSIEAYLSSAGNEIKDRCTLVYNEHFRDLGSGYSLCLGLEEAFQSNPDEILFVEGDLDIDRDSFRRVVLSGKSVLTYTCEPIYANKAVVLYRDEHDRYRYAFNSDHGLLSIPGPFSCILNSGQTWKFTEIDVLKSANRQFLENSKADTNLRIIQNYLDAGMEVELIPLKRWTNCNTRDDYKKIVSYWEEEQ